MVTTDMCLVVILELALACFTAYALFRDRDQYIRSRTSEIQTEVTRSDKTMAALHTVYGAAIASTLVLLNTTEALAGNKVVFVLVNFLCFTYLFYFSSWFRNSIFMPIRGRVRKD